MVFPGDVDVSHVVFLTVDCLRADAARELDTVSGLMDAHVDVPDCQCTGSGTPTSMPGIMQSRLPTEYGGRAARHPLVPDVPTLAEALADGGFTGAGWHSNPNTSRAFGYQRGFDVLVDLQTDPRASSGEESSTLRDGGNRLIGRVGRAVSRKLGIEERARRGWNLLKQYGVVERLPYARSEAVFDELLDWFPDAPTESPRFAWGHLMDLHDPYRPPIEYRRRVPECHTDDDDLAALNGELSTPQEITATGARRLRGMYDATARYVDDQIARLIEELTARDLWDETLLVVTSDHGEMFGDRPIPDDYPFKHPNYLCDYITHVPLVFAGGALPEETIGGVASGADVAPTIAALVGAAIPERWNGTVIGGPEYADRTWVHSVTGRGTRQDHTDGEIPHETFHASLRTERETVLWWSDSAHGPEFYDRSTTHDDPTVHETPIEGETLAGSDARIRAIVDRFEDATARRAARGDEGTSEPDEEVADRLRELGYIE
jgi:arylsulfatase